MSAFISVQGISGHLPDQRGLVAELGGWEEAV